MTSRGLIGFVSVEDDTLSKYTALHHSNIAVPMSDNDHSRNETRHVTSEMAAFLVGDPCVPFDRRHLTRQAGPKVKRRALKALTTILRVKSVEIRPDEFIVRGEVVSFDQAKSQLTDFPSIRIARSDFPRLVVHLERNLRAVRKAERLGPLGLLDKFSMAWLGSGHSAQKVSDH
jgi:hypothetical protein